MKTLKNYFLNSSYQLLVIIIPVITIPYISRVLGKTGIGINTFTYTVVQYFILIGSLGIALYGNREIAYHQKDKSTRSQVFWEIVFLRFCSMGLAILAFIIFLFFVGGDIKIYLLQSIALLAAVFDISWYFMGMENFQRTVIRNFLVQMISLFSIFTFVHTSEDLWIYILIVTGSTFLGNISLWLYLPSEVFRPRLSYFKNINNHFMATLALFFPQIAVSIYLLLNKLMLGILDSTNAAGFFAQSDSIIRISFTIVTSLSTVMMPKISALFIENDIKGIHKQLKLSITIMLGLAFPLAFGILAVSQKFAPWFFGSQFAEVGILMALESPIIIFLSMGSLFGTQYLIPTKRTKILSFSYIYGAIINLVANFIAIPLYGAKGAITVAVLTEGIVTIYQMYHVRKEFDYRNMFQGTWKYLVSAMIMCVIVYGIIQSVRLNIITLTGIVVVGILIYSFGNIILKSRLYEEVKAFRKK
ncbi:polysaccharide biosynthesis C-terminal domain-containing protein [Lactococcus protaetiae]|uniref:Oligosaccharide flippase family protein n=1 Tax=Lactococcus protaetiae TaxID=2592653 RepID=A0A514Z7B5_9LACT|nr:polysaccharide biosynthesis C-terminal domain-containing protein [Lactococcus protaetiae]QDK70482.1 oligosaccharide flippase family protein [Lactococcus protaetiae]